MPLWCFDSLQRAGPGRARGHLLFCCISPVCCADRTPKPLHQLARGDARRLRTGPGGLFEAALLCRPAVERPRQRRGSRQGGAPAPGSAVISMLMRGQVVAPPACPKFARKEQKTLQALLRQLSRDRKRAFEGLAHTLRGAPYLALASPSCRRWQRSPRFTPDRQLPLALLVV